MTSSHRVWILAAGAMIGLAPPPPTTQPTSRPADSAPAPAPAPGTATTFDAAGSDPRAIEIAESVMGKLGGRGAWEQTRYITWDFFGRRRHLWDKQMGRLRLEGNGPRTNKPFVMLLDLNTSTGRAWQGGEEITGSDLADMVRAGVAAWINDSYWLVMPYKLEDPGVTLHVAGPGELPDGRPADVLALTFSGVGLTPRNKYHVWVARDTGLVEQWAYFATAEDPQPEFTLPWTGWKRYGRIMLSGDRGESNGRHLELTGIGVLDDVPESAFTSFDPVDWDALVGTEHPTP